MKKINTLLLVDDDPLYQFLTEKMVDRTKLVVKIKMFSNGFEAIEFLRSVQATPEALPEVIFLDLNMPIMDGWEFLEEFVMLRPVLPRKITIYVVSSSIADSDVERARSISAVTDYIVKPVSADQLMHALSNLSNL